MGAQVHLGTGESVEVPRGRVCSRAGCGMLLVGPDGRPIYHRHFCSAGCKKADVRDRQRERRRRFAGKKCPYCGRQSTGDRKFQRGVSRHSAPGGAQAALASVSASEAAVVPSERP